jgi:uncharacterized coiled-coil DUF342 family protein
VPSAYFHTSHDFFAQARQLRRAMAASNSSSSASRGAVADIQRLLDEAVAERDSLAAQLREVQAAAASLQGVADRASDEAGREREERLALQQQLEALRDGLDAGSASAAAADARVAGLQVCSTELNIQRVQAMITTTCLHSCFQCTAAVKDAAA